MKLHELKIKYKYWLEVNCDNKPFELRKNDRDYQVDDLIKFNVIFDNSINYVYDNENFIYKIIYILKDVPEYGLDKNYCILGIMKLEHK